MPLLSVITATYNSLRFFDDTKRSVLESEISDLEWIIVDDGSTDGTRKVLKNLTDPRIKLHLKDHNTGIGDAYKIGVSLASGQFLLILDHDDTIPYGSLIKRIESLDQEPSSNVAFGMVSYMNEDGVIYKQPSFPFTYHSGTLSSLRVLLSVFISPSYPLKQGCVILRTDFVKTHLGIYDIELFLKAVASGPVMFVNESCLNYRTFRSQYSSSRKKRVMTFLHLYWARYSLKYLPKALSPFFSVYKTLVELAKVLWCFLSPRR